jgi:hypothetical protein
MEEEGGGGRKEMAYNENLTVESVWQETHCSCKGRRC